MARILIIDDDENMLYLLRQILQSAGHDVYEAADGAAGLELFRQARPELVITDIFMPEQDGLETVLALKREFPTVKVIAMSGGGECGELGYLATIRTLGADRVLIKPIPRQELLTIVQELSEKTRFSN
jgi:CheY-like chemotaxis protein